MKVYKHMSIKAYKHISI